ncbi:MAG: hypothetical protein ABJA57_08495 [Ginsengibacter sp.]
MKIEQVIVQHLYNNKQISLQGIGTFKLDNFVPHQADPDKELVIPANSISFEYNSRATEDPALIDSIVLHTKKIKPLATADLDSYLMLGRQFLNIGKPFVIDGLGTLDRTREGGMEFIAGQFTNLKIEPPKALKENEGEVISGLFNDYGTKPESNSRRNTVMIVSLIVLAVIGWAIYHYLFSKKTTEETLVAPITVSDTPLASNQVKPDSNLVAIDDSSSHKPTADDNDGYTFRIVFKITNSKEAAKTSMNKLNSWGHKVIMYTQDSVNYKLAELFKLPLSDTTRARDSLYKFYDAKNIIVEVK